MTRRRFAIYARVAPNRPYARLKEQVAECELAVLGLGGIAVATFTDVSIAMPQARSGYGGLLRGVSAGQFDAIMCVGLDRLSRSAGELGDLSALVAEGGISLHGLSCRECDELTLAVFDMVSRAEVVHRAVGARHGREGRKP